jgi:hypothetical protein
MPLHPAPSESSATSATTGSHFQFHFIGRHYRRGAPCGNKLFSGEELAWKCALPVVDDAQAAGREHNGLWP